MAAVPAGGGGAGLQRSVCGGGFGKVGRGQRGLWPSLQEAAERRVAGRGRCQHQCRWLRAAATVSRASAAMRAAAAAAAAVARCVAITVGKGAASCIRVRSSRALMTANARLSMALTAAAARSSAA